MAAQPIPEGYHALTPYLVVDGAADAIEFYKRAFGATERGGAMQMPDGRIAHAELEIGDSVLMISDPSEESAVRPPKEVGGTTVGVFTYVEDVDAIFQRALDAGATVRRPLEDQFWGDRYGTLTDPFGHEWHLAMHMEDVSAEEMEERVRAAMAGLTGQ
jgi:PhnB protein